VLATSLQDGGRQAALALSAALDAAAHGSRVYVFLALESTTLGTPTGVFAARPAGFDRELGDYVSELMRLGGRVAVCSSCYREYCRHLPQRDDGKGAVLRERVVVESLATLAERAQAMPTLCF
jgi:predicted peroxiredoxin